MAGILRGLRQVTRKAPLDDWYRVHFDQDSVEISAEPPFRRAWTQRLDWDDVERVVFQAEGPFASDTIYLFTSERPESYVVPAEAEGASALWEEILRRGLFDAELAIKAAGSTSGIFVWPPANE